MRIDLVARLREQRRRRDYLRDVYGYDPKPTVSRAKILDGPKPEVVPDAVAVVAVKRGDKVPGHVPMKQSNGKSYGFAVVAGCDIEPGDHLFLTGCDDGGRVVVVPGPTPQKRRAVRMRRNGGYRPFTWNDVVEMYGLDCHLCGEPVCMDVPPTHKRYGTIDHVIPVAAGGQHNIENARPAHRSCNSSKGAKVEEKPNA